MKQILTHEICKELPNKAALGAFNSAIASGATMKQASKIAAQTDELNRHVSGLNEGKTLRDVVNSLNRDKIGLENIKKKIETLKSEYDPGDRFFREIQKGKIEVHETLKRMLERDIKQKADFLKKHNVKV